MALTRTAKNWILGLLGAGATGTGYVLWRRHREGGEYGPRRLGAPHHAQHGHQAHHAQHGPQAHGAPQPRHFSHENERGHYGHHHHHHHHKEHGHGD